MLAYHVLIGLLYLLLKVAFLKEKLVLVLLIAKLSITTMIVQLSVLLLLRKCIVHLSPDVGIQYTTVNNGNRTKWSLTRQFGFIKWVDNVNWSP